MPEHGEQEINPGWQCVECDPQRTFPSRAALGGHQRHSGHKKAVIIDVGTGEVLSENVNDPLHKAPLRAGVDLGRSPLHGSVRERVIDLDPIIAFFWWWDNMIMERQLRSQNGDVPVEWQSLEEWLKQLVIQYHAEHWQQFQLQDILSVEDVLTFLKARRTSAEVKAFMEFLSKPVEVSHAA